MNTNQDDHPVDLSGGEESYEQLLDDYSHVGLPAEGELIQGHVVQVAPQGLIVDVGQKLEGVVPLSQVSTADGQLTFQPGDPIDVLIDRRHPPAIDGYISLTHERAASMRAWETLEHAYRANLRVLGHVLGRVKGGLSVDVGVIAFMPSTQVDTRQIHNVDSFIGQDIEVKIIKLNRRRDNVVVSRKAAMEEDQGARKSTLLGSLHEGDLVQGVVKNLTEYGAFIDLGGIDGLLHVSDISYGRVAHPSDVLQVGQETHGQGAQIRPRKRTHLARPEAGRSRSLGDDSRPLQQGMRVVGRVVSIKDYGAFLELEAGVEGLIHISEMTWSRRMKHPSKVVKVGDNVECVVLEVKPAERRISLGIKQLEADPWTTVDQRYSVGSVVEGRVRKLTDFGAFVEIEEGIDGLVHVSDLSWTKRIQHPSEVLKKGQVVQAVVLQIDAQGPAPVAGHQAAAARRLGDFLPLSLVGDIVQGRPSRTATFGVFVELLPGVEGLCHNSEIPPEMREQSPPLPLGVEANFKIIKLNEVEKRIGLTLSTASAEQERQRLGEYQRQAEQAGHGIGEAAHTEANHE